MSEIKVNSIKGVGASAAAITVNNTDGTCTANITNNLSNRNKVINGSAIVSQRGSNTVIGVADGGFFCADRFKHVINDIGGYTIHHEADAPSGFSHSHKVQTTTADTSLTSSSVYMIRYIFEGQDVQDFAKGTSDAKQYALSFFVKTSNFTGTFVVELIDSVNTRHCCKSYSVSSAGSWQKVELIFPADTTGALTSDNAGRFEMNFYLGAGSGYTSGTLQTTWASRSGDANRAAGQTAQIGSSTSNRFQITGVQLEAGSVATDFEHRSFGQELQICKRYYETFTPNLYPLSRYNTGGAGTAFNQFFLEVEKRAIPTVSHSGTFTSSSGFAGTPSFTNIKTKSLAIGGVNISANETVYLDDSGAALIKFDSEL
jgi:hypothetical protein